MKRSFEICVVGAGMFGSAAAKYLSYQFGSEVLLIGQSEPARNEYENHDIFGAYYDEGRITRNLDIDPLWGQLAARSISRYRDIERESGIEFYKENGYLAGGKPDSKYVEENIETARVTNTPLEVFETTEDFQKSFPYIQLPSKDHKMILETQNAGSINPRKLVQAQIALAQANDCHYLNDTVTKIVKEANSWTILTRKHDGFVAKKVVLCPGSYSQHLLPEKLRSEQIDMKQMGTMLIRIPVEDPLLITKLMGNHGEFKALPNAMVENYENDGVSPAAGSYNNHPRFYFWMAPLLYPDGKYYLKFGDSYYFWKCILETPDDVSQWWKNGAQMCAKDATRLAALARKVFPDLSTTEFVVDVCVIGTTPTERPYIDEVERNFFVALGGNGYGAKSSDEIGRLTAKLTAGEPWDFSFPREAFKCLRQKTDSKL